MYRVTARNTPRACKAACQPARTLFTPAPFFPQFNQGPLGAFSNDVFRLLDSAAAELVPQQASRRSGRRSFNPRFDVKEAGSSYELQGELPGFEQKDLEIEFVDERTLIVRGKSASEHSYTNTTADKGKQKAVAATEDAATSDNASEKSASYHKATVEDEYVDAGAESETKTPASSDTVAAAPTAGQEAQSAEAEPQYKYWVSERSAGEFERRFAFPGRVNQDEVTASLKNGILSIVVPKIVEKEARRIAIQ